MNIILIVKMKIPFLINHDVGHPIMFTIEFRVFNKF